MRKFHSFADLLICADLLIREPNASLRSKTESPRPEQLWAQNERTLEHIVLLLPEDRLSHISELIPIAPDRVRLWIVLVLPVVQQQISNDILAVDSSQF